MASTALLSHDSSWTRATRPSSPPSQAEDLLAYAKALPDSDAWGDDNEEMYHSVRFRVTSNGVTSPWTPWEDSTVVSFHL